MLAVIYSLPQVLILIAYFHSPHAANLFIINKRALVHSDRLTAKMKSNTNKFVFSYYNLALPAFARRAAVRRAAIDRYLLPVGPQLGQTAGRTDARQMHRPCSIYYAGSANNTIRTKNCRWWRADDRPTELASTGHVYSHSSRAASQGTRRLFRHAARLVALSRSCFAR